MATMTEKMAWTEVIALATEAGNTELVAFAQHRLEKIADKAANRKLTAVQKENEVLVSQLFAAMEIGVTYTAAQLGAMIGVTTPKATALAKKLVEAGCVKQVDVKIPANKAAGIKGGKVKGYIALAPEIETETEVETEEIEG